MTYKRIFYANIEDFGKDYLAFDESIYKFKCKMFYKFDNPLVNQLIFQCITGQWRLIGSDSKCIPKDDGKFSFNFSQLNQNFKKLKLLINFALFQMKLKTDIELI